MKTKREILKHFAEHGNCEDLKCTDCPYHECSKHCPHDIFTLKRIGAMAILRMFKEKKKPILGVGTKIKFSTSDIATISKIDCGSVSFYNLVFGNGHRESLDYLISKTWEVVE